MIEQRPVWRSDRDGVRSMLELAFGGPNEARLVDRMWADKSIISERIINDDEAVAYAASSPVTIVVEGAEPTIAMGLAPVAVSPSRQRSGLGAKVVGAVLEDAFSLRPSELMFVLGDPAYYRRFGFAPAEPLGFRWEGGQVGDAFQVKASGASQRSNLSALQEERSADPASKRRALVKYCAAFRVFEKAS